MTHRGLAVRPGKNPSSVHDPPACIPRLGVLSIPMAATYLDVVAGPILENP